jgi:uncharacterized protein (TIGR00369 family)
MSTEPLTREQLQQKLEHSPFIRSLGLEVVVADHEKQELTVRTQLRPEFERAVGSKQWHGGVISALIDTVGDYGLVMLIGHPLPTINFRVDYLRPAIDTSLTLVARVRRAGKSVGVVDIDVFNDACALVAIGRANYSTLAST